MSEHGAVTVSVDQELCVSSGNCALTAPAVFDQDDEVGTVILLTAHPDAGDQANVEMAESLCPVKAIRVTTP